MKKDWMPVVAGVIAAAAALEEITLHPADPLPAEFRTMMYGGLVMFFGSIGIAAYRSWRAFAYERVAGGVAAALLLYFGRDLDGVVLLVLIDLLILVVMAVGYERVARFRRARGLDEVGRSTR